MASVILDHTPAEVIRTALIQLGLGSNGIAYEAWPVFHEMEPDQPDNVITCIDTEGIVQARDMPTGEVQENHGVLIRVRATKEYINGVSYSGGLVARNKVDDIVRTLDQDCCQYSITVTHPTGSTNYTLHSANRNNATVIRIGRQRNNKERYIYTVSYLLALTQD